MPSGSHSSSQAPCVSNPQLSYQQHTARQVSAAFTAQAVANHEAAFGPNSPEHIPDGGGQSDEIAKLEADMMKALVMMSTQVTSFQGRPGSGAVHHGIVDAHLAGAPHCCLVACQVGAVIQVAQAGQDSEVRQLPKKLVLAQAML
jgi:hypothetical protein